MRKFRISNLGIKPKLITLFLLVGVVPVAIAAWIAYGQARRALDKAEQTTAKAMEKQLFEQLSAIRDEKRSAIEQYFSTINDQVLTFSEDRMVVDAMSELREAFSNHRAEQGVDATRLVEMRKDLATYYANEFSEEYKNQNGIPPSDAMASLGRLDDDSIALQHAYIRANDNPLGSKHKLDRDVADTRYNRLHAELHPVVRSYLEKFGYYDIFLCDAESGDVIYSVFKELDYSTSLVDGPYAKTNFGEAFRRANAATDKDVVVLVDYAPYAPSYQAPASFIASPIFDGDQKIGVAVFQMPLDRVTTVMSERAGLGETGEAYLVGPNFLMRSDTYRDAENHSVAGSYRNPDKGKVETAPAKAALAGETGASMTKNYLGSEVLSAFSPTQIGELKWALIAEIETNEAFASVKAMESDAASAQSTLLFWVTAVVIASVVVIVFVAWGVAEMIARPLQKAVSVLEAVADGDLKQRLDMDGQDEMGRMATALNQAVASSQRTMEEVKQSAEREKETQARRVAEEKERQEAESAKERQRNAAQRKLAEELQHKVDQMLQVLDRVVAGDYSLEVEAIGDDAIGRLGEGLRQFFKEKLAGEERERENQQRERENQERERREQEQMRDHVNQMLEVLNRVTQGDYSLRVEADGDDAIGQLGGGLRQFIQDKQETEERERENQERERENQERDRLEQQAVRNKVDELLAVVNAAAQGDLTQEVTVSGDDAVGELANGLRQMLNDLRSVISQVVDSADQFAEGAGLIAENSQNIAHGAQTQSASVEEMNASIDELTRNIEAVSQNAKQANEVALETNQIAQEGGKAVKESFEAMELIKGSAGKIGEIIQVISEIAEQTNLLALNAAIEAARAGQHGMGFAVVADEVRGLAERSNKAADEVSTLIKESTQRVEEGAVLSQQTGEVLEKIIEGVEVTAARIGEIATATGEQSQNANEVATAIQQVSQVTERVAASSEEMASGSEELGAQSVQLRELVRSFKVDPNQTTTDPVHLESDVANKFEDLAAVST